MIDRAGTGRRVISSTIAAVHRMRREIFHNLCLLSTLSLLVSENIIPSHILQILYDTMKQCQ